MVSGRLRGGEMGMVGIWGNGERLVGWLVRWCLRGDGDGDGKQRRNVLGVVRLDVAAQPRRRADARVGDEVAPLVNQAHQPVHLCSRSL